LLALQLLHFVEGIEQLLRPRLRIQVGDILRGVPNNTNHTEQSQLEQADVALCGGLGVEVVADGELVAELNARRANVNEAASNHQTADRDKDDLPTVLEMPPTRQTVDLLLGVYKGSIFQLDVIDAFPLQSVGLDVLTVLLLGLVDGFLDGIYISDGPRTAYYPLLHPSLEGGLTAGERHAELH